VDVPSSVGRSGIQSLSHLRSLAYASKLKNSMLGRGGCMYTYPGGTPSSAVLRDHSLLPGSAGGVPGGGSTSSGGGGCMPLQLQRVCRFFAVAFW